MWEDRGEIEGRYRGDVLACGRGRWVVDDDARSDGQDIRHGEDIGVGRLAVAEGEVLPPRARGPCLVPGGVAPQLGGRSGAGTPERSEAVPSATFALEAARSRTRGNGWTPSGLGSGEWP